MAIKIIFRAIIFSVILFSGCAMQQDVVILDERVASLQLQNAKLEKEVKLFKSQMENVFPDMKRITEDSKNKSAGIYVNIDKLKDRLQLLSGNIEESDFLLKQRIKSIKDSLKSYGDKTEKNIEKAQADISRIEQYLNFEASAVNDYKKKDYSKLDKSLGKDELYMFAKQAFDNNDMETARTEFLKFLKQYPKSKNADNAQFWIGETYYREKWYEKAILEYQKVIEKYPKGNKLPSALLKQGFAFNNIGDNANARLVLKELIKKYPKSNETAIARQKIKRF